jgi:dipeptidyl aminopeptidase/acylaminoacyl peptidase
MCSRSLALCLVAAFPLAAQDAGTAASPRPWRATDYYKLSDVAGVTMAPDGRHVAFTVTTVVEDKDRRHTEIWLARTDGGAVPSRFTSPVAEAAAPVWSPDGSVLAFTSRREGSSDNIWFLRTQAPGGEAFQIPGVKASPVFSPDGRTILFAWGGEEPESLKAQSWRSRVSPKAITRGPDPKRFDGRLYTSIPFKADERGYLPPRETRRPNHLYIVRTAGGTPRALTGGDLSQRDPAWSPDGRSIAFVQDSTEAQEIEPQPRPGLYVYTLADSSIRGVRTGFTSSTSPAWSPDGSTLAFRCSRGRGEETDVCTIPAAGGAPRNLTADWDLAPGDPQWSPDGKTLSFSAETRGNAHLFAVPAAGGPVRQVTSGERTLRDFSFSRDGRALAYIAGDVTRPFELYTAALSATGVVGAERRLSSINDSLTTGLALIPADTFWFTGTGGMRIQGWLMRPHGYQKGRRYPLVLSIHGGPHSNYGNIFFPEFQMLAGQGYWMLFTNPRGSSGYGHRFTFATRGRWGMEDYDDLMQAVDRVLARGEVDTNRLAVLGGSYGGFMTNWILGHTRRFAVAQTDRSIYNWYSWYGSSDAQGLTEYEFLGAPWEADSLYRALSPMRFADRIVTPLLIVHSEDDFRTPITDAEQLFVMLRKRGVASEFVRYPRSYHGLSRTGPPWLLVDRLERIRTWFAHWIGTGAVPPAAAAASQ